MHRSTFAGLLSFTAFVAFLYGASVSEAATVEKVKGNVAIVAFDATDGQPAVGAKFFAMENGKKKAILEIIQFKNGRAKVRVAKGKAKEGMTVTAVSGGTGVGGSPRWVRTL